LCSEPSHTARIGFSGNAIYPHVYHNMVSHVELRILRRNAQSFYRNARYLYGQGEYNLAAFNIEQAMQLMLKYILAAKIGDFPRTHSLRRLFGDVKDLCPELWEFYERNASIIGNIESAYITSRYFPTSFEKIEVKYMLDAYEEFIEVAEKCLS